MRITGALPVGPNKGISSCIGYTGAFLLQGEEGEEEVGIDDSDDYNDHNND